MIFKGKENFEEISVSFKLNKRSISFNKMLKKIHGKLTFELEIDGVKFKGEPKRGDDAVWIPMYDKGIKIFANNKKYFSLENSVENIKYIRSKNSEIFPSLDWVEISEYKDKEYVIMKMENVTPKPDMVGKIKWNLPREDRDFANDNLHAPLSTLRKCVNEFYKLNLLPEDEWYKNTNLINSKIVDFHRFTVFPERYKFNSNGKSKEELNKIYTNIVERYKAVRDSGGKPKWKGTIYQGFEFDNGYSMKGYTSDSVTYDSYKKIPFIPYGKVKGKKVLDIGSNQGFFSFQAAIHGASEVLGIELQKEDYLAANDINEILGFDNVSFLNGDAMEYLLETKDHYGLIIANSVLHQVYKNLEGADPVLEKIAKHSDFFAFETPVRHPTTTIGLKEIKKKLDKHFKVVRLLYFYDAYSTGYRANFVCYS